MKPKHSSSDIISGLPEIIIETILCLVPIRDAVTTSILSKKWRYSWNKIPKLVFNVEDMFNKLKEKHREEEDEENIEREEEDEENTENEVLTGKYKFFYAIHQVLLMHHGSIIEFSLSMKSNYKCVELDQIITYLSRKNTVKKLTLELNGYNSTYELLLSFFSFHQLTTDLYLQHCNLEHHQPIVDGFGMLTSLFLNNVDITGEQILHIVSKSPLLKSFSLVQSDYRYAFSRVPMCDLFGYIPAIEHLYLAILHFNSNWSSLRELPTPLVHLKYTHLLSQCFTGRYGLPFVVFLMRNSPNLEKLNLQSFHYSGQKSGIDSLTEKEYLDIWLEHLKELELFVADTIPELEFLKLILARSPMLKEVNILLNYSIDKDAETEMLRVLSDTPRASDVLEIIVERLDDPESPTDG